MAGRRDWGGGDLDLSRHPPFPERSPWRISIVGTSGSGKTTLARQLSARLAIPHIELDGLFWEPNWQGAETEVFVERVEAAIAADSWVIDGNYRRVRSQIWERANVIVWLDLSRPLVMRRILWRTAQRVLRRQELWNGNRETLLQVLCSRNSIIAWAWKTHPQRRLEYATWFSTSLFNQVTVVQLRSPQAVQDWVVGLPQVTK